jgi:hypothetical protein
MRRPRFTIATLLVAVVLAAVGLAGLRESDQRWDSDLFTATLGVMSLSVLLAVHCYGERGTLRGLFSSYGPTTSPVSSRPSSTVS